MNSSIGSPERFPKVDPFFPPTFRGDVNKVYQWTGHMGHGMDMGLAANRTKRNTPGLASRVQRRAASVRFRAAKGIGIDRSRFRPNCPKDSHRFPERDLALSAFENQKIHRPEMRDRWRCR